MNILFYTEYLGFGGHCEVLRQTASALVDTGEFNLFIMSSTFDSEYIRTIDKRISLILLSDYRVNLKEDISKVVKELIDNHISLVCTTIDLPISEYKKKCPQCKFLYWLHSKPLWEIQKKQSSIDFLTAQTKYKILNFLPFSLTKNFVMWQEKKRVKKIYLNRIKNYDFIAVLCLEYIDEFREIYGESLPRSARFVSLINFQTIKESVKEEKSKTIVWAGRLEHNSKRLDRLIEVWCKVEKDLPDWTLKIYGDGWAWYMYEDLIKRYGLKRCLMMGKTNDIQSVYDEASIVCLTSQFEGFPMALIEGQNNGCIPVTFDSYGAAKFIIGDDGEYGRRIPPFDLEAYAKALKELCSNESERKEMQQRILKKRYDYTFDKVLPIWRDIKRICEK